MPVIKVLSSLCAGVFAACAVSPSLYALEPIDFSGSLAGEYQSFFQSPALPSQPDDNLSLSFSPEFSWQAHPDHSFRFIPFVRLDQDGARQHADVRELLWTYYHDRFEVRAGVNKVFWGVAESQHLVDFVNQTDFVESIDGEEKLGQPMLGVSLSRDWGLLDVYILPYFRERTFASDEGRFYLGVAFPAPFAKDDAIYESSREQNHIDYALRWSYSFSSSDLSLSYFHGTNRNPEFEFQPTTQMVHPVYYQADRIGLEYQHNLGNWLLKLEAVHHNGEPENFNAAVGGFEYTLYGVFDSVADLGLLFEYNYNSRGFDDAKALNPTLFQNDSFYGARLALNDVGSTSLLAGIVFDHDNHGKTWFIEAGRRFGNHLNVNLEARGFEEVADNDALFAFKRDRFLELEVMWHF